MSDAVPARFYYGWLNVALAAVAMSATLPGRTYGLGLIKEPLRADLGIGDLQFNVLNFWAIIVGASVVLPVGRLIDWLGTRFVLVFVSLSLGGCVLGMSRAMDETSLAIWLTLVRGFGQGALSVVAIAMVGKWFRRRIGLAMGIFSVLLGVGFVIPLSILKPMIETEGWRAAWSNVGYSLIGFAVLGGLVVRSSPESFGVKPDDAAPTESGPVAGHTLVATLLTPAFWVYTATATLLNLVFSAVTLDNELLLKERGLPGIEQQLLTALFVAGLASNLLSGWLARRVAMKKLLAVGSLFLALSLAVFPFVDSPVLAQGYAALLGASGGVITVVYFAIYGHTYGRAHLGSIQAAVQVCSVFASATGPVAMAYCRETTGGTNPFFFGFAAVAVLLGLLCWIVPAPAREGVA